MKLKKILQNALLLFVALVFAAAIVETTVRLTKVELHSPRLFISQTEGVPYKLRPDFHGQTTTGIPLDINSMGLRDREYPLEPGLGTFRIAIIGDSVTMGQAVKQEDSYPEQLEALYAAEKEKGLRNTSVEVINAGVSGYGTREEAMLLRETAIKYNPDLIIVGFGFNDIAHVPFVLRGKDAKTRMLFRIKEFVKYNFWSYGYLMRKMATFKYNIANIGRKRNATASEVNEEDYTMKNEDWNKTYQAMAEIKAMADGKNAKLVIAVLPEMRFFTNTTPQAYGYERLHESISGQFMQIGEETGTGIEIADLLPALRNHTRAEITVSETDAHPNRKGHEIIARAIKDFLDQKGLAEKP